MPVLLFSVHFMCTLAALLFGYNWFTIPNAIDMQSLQPREVVPQLSTEERRTVVALTVDGQSLHVICDTVGILCTELERRPIPKLQVWLFSAGFLGGDWIVQAKEGEQTWVSFEAQRRKFAWMKQFYTWLAALFVSLAVGLGYLLYFRREKKTSQPNVGRPT